MMLGDFIVTFTAAGRLRRNDPSRTDVSIDLWDEVEDDDALAHALERNDYVNEIQFDGAPELQEDHPPRRWDNLLRVLTTREKLERVSFSVSDWHRPPITSEITSEHAMILQAVQENPCVRSVKFNRFNLASGETISSFLDSPASLTKFELEDCIMTTQGAGTIAAALQRNTNLQTLNLRNLNESHLTLMLQGLEMNASLQSLSLRHQTLNQVVLLAVQNLLERTPSMQCLELMCISFSEENFRPICEGLIRSTTVSKVRLDQIDFTDLASVNLFKQLVETKPNLQYLCIDRGFFPENLRHLFRNSLSEILLRPNSPLRTLELMAYPSCSHSHRRHRRSNGGLASLFPGLTFGTLLTAVGKSGLERFRIGAIYLEEQFQTLLISLPAMKIQDLEFEFYADYLGGGQRNSHAVLQAVKRNFTLQSLKVISRGENRPFFTDDDKRLLEFYFDRNELLAQWVASPGTIPRRLWPEALKLAMEAGEDTLYRSLEALLGDEIESAFGKRKRQVDEDDEAS